MTDDVYALSFVSIPAGTSVPGCEQTNSCFLPYSVTVNVGDQVIWSNDDTAAHTVTSNDGSFDSGLFMAGTSFSHTFSQAGEYPYFCIVHPWMTGVVNVQGAPSIEYYSLEVSVSPSTVLEDEIAVISGQLYASQYISGYEISVKFETDTGLSGGTWILDGGHFNTNAVWPVGVHTITYYFNSDAGTLVSNSITLTVKTPDLPGTIITLDPFTSSITTDEGKVSFSGQLTSENGLAIYGKMVIIQAESGGSGQSLSAITDSNGRFTAELGFGTESKVWTIYAKFEGDSEYKKSSSNIRQLTVTSAPVPPPPAPPGTDVIISLGSSVPGCEQTNSCYSPSTISIDVGDTITWYNADTAAHTITSGNAADGPDGVFDSGLFMSGTSFSHTFSQADTYPYFDMTHPWMSGVVIVVPEPEPVCGAGTILKDGVCVVDTEPVCGPNQVFQLGVCQDIDTQPVVVAWDKPTYKICDTGTVTVIDENLNKDSNLINFGSIQFTSDSDPSGVEVFLVETGENTSTFVGSMQLCGELSVSEGDKVYATYGNIGDAATIEFSAITPITVFTDRTSYSDGDTIRISGKVGEILSGYQVTIQVYEPSIGQRVYVNQVSVEVDTTFSDQITAGGPLWESSGTYTVKVLYGSEARTAKTTFTFTASVIPPPPPGTDVEIPLGSSVPGCETTNSCWIPSTISVDVGYTVTWYNADTAAHTVTSGTGTPNGIFDSSLFMAGTSFSHTFSQAGEYPYFCMVHPWMTGLVLVEGKTISQSDAGTLQINDNRFTISKYNPAEVILSGEVTAYSKGTPVLLQLIFPDGSVVEQKILVSSAKNFGVTFFLDENYPTGSYTITAQYDSIDFTPISFQAVAEEDTTITSISVSTDRTSYTSGDNIFITGKTTMVNNDVTIMVQAPNGNILSVAQVMPSSSGTFSIELSTDATLWEQTGTHTITAQQGQASSDTTFTFTASVIPPPPPGTDVEIPLGSSVPGCETTNSCWIPSTISVDVGDTVTWYNADTAAHTITSGNPTDGPDGVFDSNMLMSGSTFDVTFSQAGTYPYFDMLHPWQAGTVIVGDGGTITPTISVSTDRSSYSDGNTIIITGEVGEILSGNKVTIQVFEPSFGQRVYVNQVSVEVDTTFSDQITAGGPLWESSGTYTVNVLYGTEAITAEATFTFTAVPKISSSVLILDSLPSKVNREDFVLMTGRLQTESGIPITFRTVNLVSDNNGEIAASTTTDSVGQFAFNWNVKYNYNTYRWYVEFTGDNQFTPSNSAVQSVSVILRPELYFTPLPNRVDDGTTLTFSGQLTAEGLPLPGKTIYIKDDVDFGTDTNLGSVTTDQNGEFSATWDTVPRSSGSYDFYAVFEGDSEALRVRSATYSVYVTVTQVFEPVRVYTEKTIFSEGDSLRVYGSATPNEELEIALMDSRENIITQKSIRVDSTGSFSMVLFTWQSSSNVNFGEYGVLAWSPIDMRYDGLWVSFIKIEPETFQTKITLNRPQSSVTLNEPITFTGQLQTTDGQPLTFTTVGIATITDQVPEALHIGTTDSSGRFSITWTSRYTSSSTTIPVYAYFMGNQVFDHSISNSYNITIEKPSLSLFTEKTSYKAGELLIAYGYGSPGDTVNVSLRSQQGQIMSSSVKVAPDGSYTIFFDLIGISQGSYTVTATSSSFGITDSTTIFVETKEIPEEIDVVGDVYFLDQGRKVPLSGIKAVLDIGASQRIDYVDLSGKFEFNNINFDSRVDYLIHFEMSDGKSFNFIDSQLYGTSSTSPPVIKSRTMLLNIDETLATNHFAINLGLNMPSSYSSTDAYYINKAFDLQNKIVEFYNRVLNEKPPMINVFLFQDGSWYQGTVWDRRSTSYEIYSPKIAIAENPYDFWSAIGMEYTHYVQDFAYKKMHGYDTQPRNSNHLGYDNPSTADSWVEGVGTFMPAVIAGWYNMAEAGTFSKTSLERNDFKPTTSTYRYSGVWLDEEYSIATLLWDLYDRRQDGENISLSINEVWRLIEGFDDFQKYNKQDYMKKYSYSEQIADNERHIKYFKDFYDYISDYDVNRDGRIDSGDQRIVDEVFALHGIPNGYTDSGRTRV